MMVMAVTAVHDAAGQQLQHTGELQNEIDRLERWRIAVHDREDVHGEHDGEGGERSPQHPEQ